MSSSLAHRHGSRIHRHDHAGTHRHLLGLCRSEPVADSAKDGHGNHHHDHAHSHGHSHGLVDRSIVRSREGVKAVAFSLAILGVTALAQLAMFATTGSVALLADLVHNFGDALTAVPLGIAFFLRSFRGGEGRRARRRSRDLRLGLRRSVRDRPAIRSPGGADASVGSRCSRGDRLRRERARGSCTASRRPAPVEPGARRRREPRPHRRLRLARRHRERSSSSVSVSRSATRSSDS